MNSQGQTLSVNNAVFQDCKKVLQLNRSCLNPLGESRVTMPAIIKGRGKPIVFLHGYLSCKEVFAAQIDFFSRYYTVFAVDMKGFGANTPMQYPYSLDDYVNDYYALINYVGEIPDVIAHSFGCRVILKAASEKTNAAKKIVLCGAAGLKPAFSFKKVLKRRGYSLTKKILPQNVAEKIFFSSDYNAVDGVMRQSFKKIVGQYLDGFLPQIHNPVFAVFGENDKQTPISLANKLTKNISDCKTYAMKNCGHFCFLDNYTEFNYVVREFLL